MNSGRLLHPSSMDQGFDPGLRRHFRNSGSLLFPSEIDQGFDAAPRGHQMQPKGCRPDNQCNVWFSQFLRFRLLATQVF